MKKTLFILLFFIAGYSYASDDFYQQAEKFYEEGKREVAKELYLKAAEQGNLDAHFMLTYKYSPPWEERINHLIIAAKKGHGRAWSSLVEDLLERANYLERADPQLLWDIYNERKNIAEAYKDFDEDEGELKTIRMCAEPKGFNVKEFLERYDVNDEDGEYPFYDVWELAEEASRGGRFGKPDPELVLNLVCRGSWVPAELESAAEEAYMNWKKGAVEEFNICTHITSGAGMGYCAARRNEEEKKEDEQGLASLKEKMGESFDKLLDDAYIAANNFIDMKTRYEEAHDGTGRAAWMIGSEIKQRENFLDLIEKIYKGYVPETESTFKNIDKELNIIYQKILKKFKGASFRGGFAGVSEKEIRETQRSWIPYRDSAVKLFYKINPKVSRERWMAFLTDERIKQFREMQELVELHERY